MGDGAPWGWFWIAMYTGASWEFEAWFRWLGLPVIGG